jgi:hypothetical protein
MTQKTHLTWRRASDRFALPEHWLRVVDEIGLAENILRGKDWPAGVDINFKASVGHWPSVVSYREIVGRLLMRLAKARDPEGFEAVCVAEESQ